jgi:hypothetical protein
MHGGCEDEARGTSGLMGSPDAFLVGDLEIKIFLKFRQKNCASRRAFYVKY